MARMLLSMLLACMILLAGCTVSFGGSDPPTTDETTSIVSTQTPTATATNSTTTMTRTDQLTNQSATKGRTSTETTTLTPRSTTTETQTASPIETTVTSTTTTPSPTASKTPTPTSETIESTEASTNVRKTADPTETSERSTTSTTTSDRYTTETKTETQADQWGYGAPADEPSSCDGWENIDIEITDVDRTDDPYLPSNATFRATNTGEETLAAFFVVASFDDGEWNYPMPVSVSSGNISPGETVVRTITVDEAINEDAERYNALPEPPDSCSTT